MNEAKKIRKQISISKFIDKYLDVDRFLLCCEECPNYGKKHTCPPHHFDVREFWLTFSELEIYAVTIPGNQSYEQAEATLMDELLMMEKQLPGSVCLSAGNAGIVEEERMRYSIESLGGNVDKLCKDVLGISLEWGKDGALPEHITLVAGLLKK
jgi:predicted metal-binding protein